MDRDTIRQVSDSETETYKVDFDIDERNPSTVVVTAISSINDIDPLELEKLNDHVDPDSLDSLFRPQRDGTPRGDGEVSFSFAGYEVSIRSHGEAVLAAIE